MLAAECLLKDLFVLTRIAVYGTDPATSESFVLISSCPGFDKDKFIRSLQAERFKHNLGDLINFTKNMFPELDKQNPERLRDLSLASKNSDWASKRYLDPTIETNDWSDLCQKLESALLNFVDQDLKHIHLGDQK